MGYVPARKRRAVGAGPVTVEVVRSVGLSAGEEDNDELRMERMEAAFQSAISAFSRSGTRASGHQAELDNPFAMDTTERADESGVRDQES